MNCKTLYINNDVENKLTLQIFSEVIFFFLLSFNFLNDILHLTILS